MSDPPSVTQSASPTCEPISPLAAEPNLFREAWELYNSLLAKAPVLGLMVFGICGSLERAMAKHKVPFWSKVGALIGVALLIAVAIFVGCVVMTVVKRMQRLLAASDTHLAAPPQPPLPLEIGRDGDYWLLFEGRTTGPHGINVLRDALEHGDFPPQTLICAIGETQWLPLSSLRAKPAAGETMSPISQSPSEA